MPIILGNMTFNGGGRLRGLISPIYTDEPRRFGDAASTSGRRVLSNPTTSGTFNCDWSSYDEIRLTLTGSATLTFTAPQDAKGCILVVKQDGVGGRTLTLPASVRFSADITAYVASASAALQDRLGFIYNSTDAKYDFVSVAKAFA